MANETVTKSKRFYCVSVVPDFCKTPVGNSVVVIPYNIKGEFSKAQAVSKSVKTHSEPVFLHGRSFIPSVTGDAAGKLGGVKSGTFLKKVESLQHSSTKGSNGTQTIQQSRFVWMNNKNTYGRVLEKQGKAPRARLTIFGWEVPTAKEAAQAYRDNYSEPLHQFGDEAMDVGGKIGVGSAGIGLAGAGVGATGVGLPVAAAMETVAAAGGVTAGVVGGTGLAVDSAATVGDMAADYIIDGKVPDAVTAATDMALNAAENVVFKRIPGGGKLFDRWFKKKDVPGKTPEPPKKAPPEKGKGNDDDGVDGGKVKQDKDPKGDKPADCCPKNTAPGGKSAKSRKPAHIGTGEEILYQEDFVLAGPTPVEWTRVYRSGAETEDWGVLGARWATPYTASLSVCARGLVYVDATGRAVRLPPLADGEQLRHAGEGFHLARESADRYRLTWHDGAVDTFASPVDGVLPHGYEGVNAMLAPRAPLPVRRLRLTGQARRDGAGFDLEWFDHAAPGALLMRLRTRDGLVLEALRAELLPQERAGAAPLPPRIGRLEQVLADGSRLLQAHYRYDCADAGPAGELPQRCLLAGHGDIGGAERSYAYRHQLLVAYTGQGGQVFELEWTSLELLRARWAGSKVPQEVLAARYPLGDDNSYRARVVRSAGADGSGDTRLDYLDEDTTRVTEAGGLVFDYSFDANWLVTAVARIDAAGVAHPLGRRSWDRDGRLTADVDALGNETRYQYDAAGNMVGVIDANGHATRIDYDGHNQPVAVTDALGATTTRRYDEAGRLLESRDPLGRVTGYAYDAQGRLHEVRDARGGVSRMAYDAAGRVASYTDCSGNTSHAEYDAQGRLTRSRDAAGNQTVREYDARGRLALLAHPDGATERFGYDAEGNLLSHTDALGRVTSYVYNGYKLPVERRDALGQTLRYEYDLALRPSALVNQNGERYLFAYDDAGNLASETGFDGKVTRYTHDRAGRLLGRSSGDRHTEYAHDGLGQLLALVTPDGAVRYAYDAVGRLLAASSDSADLRFGYDAAGQLVDERMRYRLAPESVAAFTLEHAYDELGQRIRTTLPNGRQLDTLRYGSGHWHGSLWQGAPLVDLEHDRLHREVRRQFGAGSGPARLTRESAYDPASRLVSTTLGAGHERLGERRYRYDLSGSLLAIDDARRGAIDYRYDPVGQLLAATQPGLHETFAFDPAGNILDPQAAGADRSALADLDQQPLPDAARTVLPKVTHNLLQRYLGVQYSYDVQGNLALRREAQSASMNEAGVLACEYDGENQLVRAVRSVGQERVEARYVYDPFGRRIAKQVQQHTAAGAGALATTLFVWDGDTLVQEIDAARTTTYLAEPDSFVPLARVVSGEGVASYAGADTAIPPVADWALPHDRGEALAHVDAWRAHRADEDESRHQAARARVREAAASLAGGDQVLYYLCDHLGTPLELVDADGGVAWAARYRAWGGLLEERAVSTQPLRFQGQYADAETGLHYNRFRYFDPHSGRFVSQDPIRLGGGENLYRYGPNPVWWVDPLGLAAGGGGAYIFETLHGKAYVGKGPYERYGSSIAQRTGGTNNGVDRGVHMNTTSPCASVTEAQYAEMVEHEAMVAYRSTPGALPMLNSATSPGRNRLDPSHSKGKANIKNCPGIVAAARADAQTLVRSMLAKPKGSGK